MPSIDELLGPKPSGQTIESLLGPAPAAAAREPAPMPEFMGEFAYAEPYKGSPESQIPKSVREFEEQAGPFGYVKEYGKGSIAAALGLPAEMTVNLPANIAGLVRGGEGLARKGLQKAGLPVSEEPATPSIPRVGYGVPEASEFLFGKPTNEVAAGVRGVGEVLGVPTGVTGLVRGARALRALGSEEKLSALDNLRKAAEAKFGEGTAAAEQEYQRLVRSAEQRRSFGFEESQREQSAIEARRRAIEERAKQESMAPAAVTPEKSAEEVAARSTAGLPKPTTGADIAANNYPDRNLRQVALPAYERAKKEQDVGKAAFEVYENQANKMERGGFPGVEPSPFMSSPEAQQVVRQLETIAQGGAGPLTEYGKSMRALAGSIVSQLKGVGGKPADFKVVDDLIRELRDKASNKQWQGFDAVQARNFESIADRLEESLKNWVGPEFYPREIYAKSSENLNKWMTRLGNALRGAEEIPYSGRPGMFTTAESKLPDIVYESRDSVRYAKELMGSKAVNENAIQVATNRLEGKSAKEVQQWLNKTENAWIDEIPGLRDKIGGYAKALEEQEGRSLASEALKKDVETRRATELKEIETDLKSTADTWSSFVKGLEDEVKAAGGNLADVKQTLNSVGELFRVSSASKISDKWPPIRAKLESTGLFSAAELDQMGNMVAETAKAERGREKVENFTSFIKYNITKKVLAKVGFVSGTGLLGFKKLFGG